MALGLSEAAKSYFEKNQLIPIKHIRGIHKVVEPLSTSKLKQESKGMFAKDKRAFIRKRIANQRIKCINTPAAQARTGGVNCITSMIKWICENDAVNNASPVDVSAIEDDPQKIANYEMAVKTFYPKYPFASTISTHTNLYNATGMYLYLLRQKGVPMHWIEKKCLEIIEGVEGKKKAMIAYDTARKRKRDLTKTLAWATKINGALEVLNQMHASNIPTISAPTPETLLPNSPTSSVEDAD